MMTPMAWLRLISPELTKPMTIISVALLLWISTVTRMPMSTAATRLVVTRSRMPRSLSPAAFFRPVDMAVIPYRNRPTPPSMEIISQIVMFGFSFLCICPMTEQFQYSRKKRPIQQKSPCHDPKAGTYG